MPRSPGRFRTDRDRVQELLAEDGAELEPYAWELVGEAYHEGSSHPWRGSRQTGVIDAEHPAAAIIKLLTGFGVATTLDNTPELPDFEREISIRIRPLAEGEYETDE